MPRTILHADDAVGFDGRPVADFHEAEAADTLALLRERMLGPEDEQPSTGAITATATLAAAHAALAQSLRLRDGLIDDRAFVVTAP